MKRILLAASLCLASLTHAATITDVRVSGSGPVTFGQVFAVGDMKKSDVLVGKLDGATVPLQVDIKATHADGSVRHAIISAQMPKAGTMQLNTGGTLISEGTMPVDAAIPASVSATIGGIKYSATSSTAGKAAWLQGPVVNEWQSVAPLTTAAGVAHPHLTARFAIRYYTASKKTRFDVTVENAWAYETGPQNFIYATEIAIGGKSVYSKAGLTHYSHARWRKVFWDGPTVQHNTAYLIASKAVPNYDQTVLPAEKVLAAMSRSIEPMGIGMATAYMPTTGAHDDIGLLPAWQAAYVLSMDARARDATLATADGAGSWSMHYRDKNTDRPVSLSNFPRMTIVGNLGDTYNYDSKRSEYFPIPAGDITTPYTHDTAHQPSLAYLPYLLTGDYFYLEEMQFWAMYDTFMSNPNYRGNGQGLVTWDQLRGQGWSLRTLAQAAYATPDTDALKSDIVKLLTNNLDWYNATYVQSKSSNTLGVMTHGYSMHYDNGTQVAPWMDDFFTSAIGHAVDLGFDGAKPLLAWKAQFPVGRMVAPSVCWLNGAPYDYTVRNTLNDPIYSDFATAYTKTFGAPAATCPAVGDMGNISDFYTGYPSNMQPALAYAVDSGIPGAAASWKLFTGRTVKPDYSLGAQFNIVPRVAAPPVVVPPVPIKAGKVTTGANVKLAKQNPLTVTFIDPAKLALVKTFIGVLATSKGAFTVSDVLLVPGTQYLVIVGSASKPLDAFLLTVPK